MLLKRLSLSLIVVFIFALFFRVYKLNTFPIGFHVDEAKVAWESLSILKTGHDDHGDLLNLYYNSFGDYRPSGIFYATIPSLILFGRRIFAIRFPAALLGSLTIFPLYFISLTITKNKRISLISAIILSIIPWDLAASRATSEVVISCFLILTSLALIQKKPVLSFTLLSTSFLFYHSARVMGPILMFFWIIYLLSRSQIMLSKKIVLGFSITSLISAILLMSNTGLARYNQVKLPNPNLRNIIINYTSYFDPNFLIGDIAKPFRYTTSNVGIISIPILLCFVLGIYVIVKTNKNKILLLLFALGPIPASLTLEDSPNLHRAFFMLPFLVIISAVGIDYLLEKHKTLSKIMIFCIIWSFLSFIINYTNTTNNFAYQYRSPNIQEVSSYIYSQKNSYDKIYVTSDPDSPSIWYGFFNNIDPLKFNLAQEKNVGGKWQYENIIWDNIKCPAGIVFDEAKNNPVLEKIMVIDNGVCSKSFDETHKIIKEFNNNGIVNYRVWEYIPIKN